MSPSRAVVAAVRTHQVSDLFPHHCVIAVMNTDITLSAILSGTDYCVDPGGSSPSPPTGSPPSSPTNLPYRDFKGSEYCQPWRKCGVCEGDCDNDDDCEGDLICKQRDEGDSIPGCSGTSNSSK